MKTRFLLAAILCAPGLGFAQLPTPPAGATPDVLRLFRFGPSALRDGAPQGMRDIVKADLMQSALAAEMLAAQGRLAEAADRYAIIARISDDPAVSKRGAELAANAQNLTLARELAQRWATLDETDARAKEIASALVLAESDVKRALDSLTKSLPAEPEAREKMVMDLARQLARNRDRTQAVSVMRALTEREPTAATWFGVALTEFAATLPSPDDEAPRGRPDLTPALTATQRALSLNARFSPAAALRAELLARENPQEALTYAADFVKRNPEAREVRAFLAQALANEGKHAQAREEYLRLAQTDNPQYAAEAKFAAAILQLRLNKSAEANTELNALKGNEHVSPNAWLLYSGQALDLLTRYDEAIATWDKIATDVPAWRESKFRTASSMGKQGKYAEARAYLDAQLAKDEDASTPITIVQAHAGWFREAEKLAEANTVLEAGLKVHTNNVDLLYDQAMVADRIKNYTLMERNLRRVIEMRPDGSAALNALAFSFAERNINIPEARALINRAIALAPDDAAVIDSVGWVFFREGKLADSEHWLRKAYEKFADGEIASHLAEVLIAANRSEEAKKILDGYDASAPNFKLVEDARKRFFNQ
jgi:Flp pilus assembly protein TadD